VGEETVGMITEANAFGIILSFIARNDRLLMNFKPKSVCKTEFCFLA